MVAVLVEEAAEEPVVNSTGTARPEPAVSTAVIAVLTFRRERLLGSLLPQLVRQAAAAEAAGVPCRIVVVDNDPAGSAREAVSAFAGQSTIPVVYAHEPVPGISAARNRALDEARDADVLAFIDDDEEPGADWLVSLLATMDAYGSQAVLGPVLPMYETEPGAWIRAGGFFDRKRFPTGTQRDVGFTGNLLLDMRAIRRWGLRFDPAFGLTGGEDTLFTRSICARGGTIVWCDEAPVTDLVPVARADRKWVLKRRFSAANTSGIVELSMAATAPARVMIRTRLVGGGLVRVLVGAARALVGRITGSLEHQALGWRLAYRGAGLVSGALGYRYQEYRRK